MSCNKEQCPKSNGYVYLIVLYILLVIILGSYIF